jgi:mRNA-degrading endonuclease RelE of RelBE toxin-antitoxin system
VPRLIIHKDAQQDLRALRVSRPKLWGRLVALLEEIAANARLIDMLTVQGFGSDEREPFEVSRWQKYWHEGKDIWRLKFWELEYQGLPYRVIYALKRGTGEHHVLAIASRDFNYDPDHPTTRRILQAYEGL